MNKQEYKQALLSCEDITITNDFYKAIYIIDDIMISGDFYQGYRTLDHNELLKACDNVTWENVLHWGTVLVPETNSAIGKKHKNICNEHGYKCLPVKSNNHIMGYH